MAHGIFSLHLSMQTLSCCMWDNSPTRAPALRARSLSHWTTGEVPTVSFDPCYSCRLFHLAFGVQSSNLNPALVLQTSRMFLLISDLCHLSVSPLLFGYSQCCCPAGGREGTRRDHSSGELCDPPWALGRCDCSSVDD